VSKGWGEEVVWGDTAIAFRGGREQPEAGEGE
jgi:hypothetical protein